MHQRVGEPQEAVRASLGVQEAEDVVVEAILQAYRRQEGVMVRRLLHEAPLEVVGRLLSEVVEAMVRHKELHQPYQLLLYSHRKDLPS